MNDDLTDRIEFIDEADIPPTVKGYHHRGAVGAADRYGMRLTHFVLSPGESQQVTWLRNAHSLTIIYKKGE